MIAWISAISKVVLGQTMTTDDGSSLSQANIHMDVRQDVIDSDARLICDSFNRSIVRWLTDWNFPGAAYPIVKRDMEEAVDLKALAERDKTIIDMTGKKPDDKYIEDTYGLILVEPAPTGNGDPGGKPPGDDDVDLAENEGLTPLEQALDAIDAEDWEKLASPLVQPIIKQAVSEPETMLEDLAELYPELNATSLEEQLQRLVFVSDIVARLADQEGEENA